MVEEDYFRSTPRSPPAASLPLQESVILLLKRRFTYPDWHADMAPFWRMFPAAPFTKETMTDEEAGLLQDETLVGEREREGEQGVGVGSRGGVGRRPGWGSINVPSPPPPPPKPPFFRMRFWACRPPQSGASASLTPVAGAAGVEKHRR